MKRRAFLTSTAGVLTGFSLLGNAKPLEQKTVEVSIIMSKSVQDGMIEHSNQELCSFFHKAIENACQSIPDKNQELVVNRKAPNGYTVDLESRTGINDLPNRTIDGDELLKSMEEVTSEIPSQFTAKDSNIFITRANMNQKAGIGKLPLSCVPISNARTSVVSMPDFYGKDLHFSKESGLDRLSTTVVHEFGHNIGLEHEMGKIKSETESQVIVSPMISSYACSNKDHENLPSTDCSSKEVIRSTRFNTQIGLKDILTHEQCSIV